MYLSGKNLGSNPSGTTQVYLCTILQTDRFRNMEWEICLEAKRWHILFSRSQLEMGKKSENTKTPALLQSTEKLLVALRAVIKVSIQLCLDHFQTKSQFQK